MVGFVLDGMNRITTMENSTNHDEAIPLAPYQPQTNQRQNLVAILGVTIIVLLVLMTAGVFIYLPQLTDSPANVAQPIEPVVSATPQETKTSAAPFELARSRHQRGNAIESADQLLKLQIELEDMAVEMWATEDYEQSSLFAQQGDEFFQQDNFVAAADSYNRGMALLESVLSTKDARRDQALSLANAALELGDMFEAEKNFNLARYIDPMNSEASDGLARVKIVPKVIALTEKAKHLELNGEYTQAKNLFNEALALDANWQEARSGKSRINSTLADINFRQAMSTGIEHLSTNSYKAAQHSFEQALKIKPNNSDATDSLNQAIALSKTATIRNLLAEAQELISAENWQAALEKYNETLAIDANLEIAQSGQSETEEMIELTTELAGFLNNPEKLTVEDEFTKATKLLQDLTKIAKSGPQMRRGIIELNRSLKLARTEIELLVVSDGKTEVIVYRQADLGTFESTKILLYPGKYTVRGKRKGYNDVLKNITLKPSMTNQRVTIICSEQI